MYVHPLLLQLDFLMGEATGEPICSLINTFRRAVLPHGRPTSKSALPKFAGRPPREGCKIYRHRKPVAFSLVSGACSVIQITVSNSFQPGIPGSGKGANFVALTEAGATGESLGAGRAVF